MAKKASNSPFFGSKISLLTVKFVHITGDGNTLSRIMCYGPWRILWMLTLRLRDKR